MGREEEGERKLQSGRERQRLISVKMLVFHKDQSCRNVYIMDGFRTEQSRDSVDVERKQLIISINCFGNFDFN